MSDPAIHDIRHGGLRLAVEFWRELDAEFRRDPTLVSQFLEGLGREPDYGDALELLRATYPELYAESV